jgi:3-oxoacyl-[acyl-carrier-protein] synthase-1
LQTTSSFYITATSLVTPLGIGTEENFSRLIQGHSGVERIYDPLLFPTVLPLAKFDEDFIQKSKQLFNTTTRFDCVLLACINELQQQTPLDLSSPDVIIILSTTKGNVELLQDGLQNQKLFLSYSARLIQQKLNNSNAPIVVSNACISGISAIIIAKRLLAKGTYKHAVIVGCDVLTKFVISGFASFHAISTDRCKPFDKNRTGINLGEAAAAMILSSELASQISVHGGYISNDANHISGPSKTGEELSFCIHQSLKDAGLTNTDIGFILAHGTATDYNDEMESKAFSLSGLHYSPVFSLKAMYGHTLGASGVLETIISAECLKKQRILPNVGFSEKGVSGDIIISEELQQKDVHTCLKTASGFGGCNAAIILKRSVAAN